MENNPMQMAEENALTNRSASTDMSAIETVTDRPIKLFIVPHGYPKSRLTQAQADTVEKLLVERIEQVEFFPDGSFPVFDGLFMEHGALVIYCTNQLSRDWLVAVTQELQPLEGNIRLVAKDLLRVTKVLVRVPGMPVNSTPGQISSILDRQNPTLRVAEWQLISFQENSTGLTLTYQVDDEVLPFIRATGGKVHVYLWKASILILQESNDARGATSQYATWHTPLGTTRQPAARYTTTLGTTSQSATWHTPLGTIRQPAARYTTTLGTTSQLAARHTNLCTTRRPAARYTTTLGTMSRPAARYTTTLGTMSRPAARYTTALGTTRRPAARYTTMLGTTRRPAARYTTTLGTMSRPAARYTTTLGTTQRPAARNTTTLGTMSRPAARHTNLCSTRRAAARYTTTLGTMSQPAARHTNTLVNTSQPAARQATTLGTFNNKYFIMYSKPSILRHSLLRQSLYFDTDRDYVRVDRYAPRSMNEGTSMSMSEL